jgi:hypothetical protein
MCRIPLQIIIGKIIPKFKAPSTNVLISILAVRDEFRRVT